MAHHSSAREVMMQKSNANSYMNSAQSSSYGANVNRASSSSTNAQTFYGADESRNYGRGGDEQQLRREDVNGRELEMKPIPDDSASPANGQPPAQAAPPSQPTYQTKPTYTPRKNNVRIVGGKLFHVEDDVEGPISIQYIPDHPDPGPRGYHVAKSTYPPVGKPRTATTAGGQVMHYIA